MQLKRYVKGCSEPGAVSDSCAKFLAEFVKRCRVNAVAPPVISKIRHRTLPVGASLLIRMHEVTQMSIRDLRDLMGDRRTKYRLSDAQGKPKPEQHKQG